MQQKIPTGMELKRINRNNIYKLLWREQRASKQNMMKKLGLSLPTVTQNLNVLCEEGLVTPNGTFRYTGGRSAIGYSIIEDARVSVGVDLNRSHIAIVVMDLNGSIISSYHEHLRFENNTGYYKHAADCVEQIMAKADVTEEKLLGIGISMQGLISQDRKEIIYGPILNTTGVQVNQVAEFIPHPCELFHDAYSAAFAELWASPDIKDAVYVSLSTNLGGAIIIDRKIFSGDSHMAGKLEHMTLIPYGEECYCGNKGCAEVYCRASNLSDVTKDGSLDTFFKRLKNADAEALKTWEDYMAHIVILFNSLHMLLDTDIILGGYMASYISPYMDELKRRTYALNSVDQEQDYIKLGQFLKEAIASGSALHYIDHFINNV